MQSCKLSRKESQKKNRVRRILLVWYFSFQITSSFFLLSVGASFSFHSFHYHNTTTAQTLYALYINIFCSDFFFWAFEKKHKKYLAKRKNHDFLRHLHLIGSFMLHWCRGRIVLPTNLVIYDCFVHCTHGTHTHYYSTAPSMIRNAMR